MAKITTSLPNLGNGGLHNNLQGLNEGDYQHLTQAEKTKLDNLVDEEGYSGVPYPTISLGGLTPSYLLTDKTANEILEDLLVVYQNPAFTFFSINPYLSQVEVGTTLSGTRDFYWITSNAVNVLTDSVSVIDVTAGNLNLATNLANDGSEISVGINSITFNSSGNTQQWKLTAFNTNAEVFQSSIITTTAYLKRFYGSVTTVLTDSNSVRALSNNEFQTSNGSTFILNTGSSNVIFSVALPLGVTISSVVDLDAAGAVITSTYVIKNSINVLDAGGNGRAYNIYEMEQAIPYTANHRHQITTI
jgi:hypothetical protein